MTNDITATYKREEWLDQLYLLPYFGVVFILSKSSYLVKLAMNFILRTTVCTLLPKKYERQEIYHIMKGFFFHVWGCSLRQSSVVPKDITFLVQRVIAISFWFKILRFKYQKNHLQAPVMCLWLDETHGHRLWYEVALEWILPKSSLR